MTELPVTPQRIKVLADQIAGWLLADPEADAAWQSVDGRALVGAWARTEAGLRMIYDWMSSQIEQGGVNSMLVPPMPGTKPPMESWMAMERSAATLRAKLGLKPAIYARIARDLGLKTEEDRLAEMDRQGMEIIGCGEPEADPEAEEPE